MHIDKISMLPKASDIFKDIRIYISPKFFKELEKTSENFWGTTKSSNSQSNPEKLKQSCRHLDSGCQGKLQRCDNQDTMALAQIQTYR